jgi:hypothetical protein
MTRAELKRHFVDGEDTPLTVGTLLTILEVLRVLDPPKVDPVCRCCHQEGAGWPDNWRWSAKCGGYICGLCVVMTERGG